MRARLILVAAGTVVVGLAAVALSSGKAVIPNCFGEPATVIGSYDNDDIDLSAETTPQVVHGNGGDDSIHGGEAGDLLCGGGGIDEVYGREGKDRINTGGGRDHGSGDEQADLLKGGPDKDGGDTIWRVGTPEENGFGAGVDGGRGNDRILGGDGNDALRGEEGDDGLSGGGGIDKCNGGPGDDGVDCEKPFPQP